MHERSPGGGAMPPWRQGSRLRFENYGALILWIPKKELCHGIWPKPQDSPCHDFLETGRRAWPCHDFFVGTSLARAPCHTFLENAGCLAWRICSGIIQSGLSSRPQGPCHNLFGEPIRASPCHNFFWRVLWGGGPCHTFFGESSGRIGRVIIFSLEFQNKL